VHGIEVRDRDHRDEISSAADSLKYQFQLQSALTFLALDNWQSYDADAPGNSLQQKYELYESFSIEQEKLKTIANQIRMSDEDSAAELDALNFEECLDSISMLKKKALQIKLQEGEVSEEQKIDIIRNAKLCSHEYGFVIHQFRALAARFSEEDYSVYDENCANLAEDEELNKRSKRNIDEDLTIIPNPNEGIFTIASARDIKKIEIINARGEIMESFNVMQTYRIETNDLLAGVYILRCTLETNEVLIKKMIVY